MNIHKHFVVYFRHYQIKSQVKYELTILKNKLYFTKKSINTTLSVFKFAFQVEGYESVHVNYSSVCYHIIMSYY